MNLFTGGLALSGRGSHWTKTMTLTWARDGTAGRSEEEEDSFGPLHEPQKSRARS